MTDVWFSSFGRLGFLSSYKRNHSTAPHLCVVLIFEMYQISELFHSSLNVVVTSVLIRNRYDQVLAWCHFDSSLVLEISLARPSFAAVVLSPPAV